MSKKSGASKRQKENYATYARESRAEKNRIAKIKRHMKKFPNDAQAEKALAHVGTRRSKSGTKGNFPKAKVVIYVGTNGMPEKMPTFAPEFKERKKVK